MARNDYSDNELVLGDRIDVSYEDQTGISDIQDITDDDKFVVSIPTVKNIPLHIPNNEKISVVYYRPNGMFSFDAIKLREFKHDVMPALEIQVNPPVRKLQRRNFVRHEKVLPVRLRILATAEQMSKRNIDAYARELYNHNLKDAPRPISKDNDKIIDGFTLDMSGGGLRLLTKEPFEGNTVLECTIDLMTGEFITADAIVIRSSQRDIEGSNDDFATSVRFINISEKSRQNLMKYIFDDQVKSRKKKNET